MGKRSSQSLFKNATNYPARSRPVPEPQLSIVSTAAADNTTCIVERLRRRRRESRGCLGNRSNGQHNRSGGREGQYRVRQAKVCQLRVRDLTRHLRTHHNLELGSDRGYHADTQAHVALVAVQVGANDGRTHAECTSSKTWLRQNESIAGGLTVLDSVQGRR